MKRIRTSMARIRREHRWLEDLPDNPRDPDVVRAKALAQESRLSPGKPARKQGRAAAIAVDNAGGAP